MSNTLSQYILNLSCQDARGIVANVAQALAAADMNITESKQYGDADSGQFFMRVAFTPQGNAGIDDFTQSFQSVADAFSMQWKVYDAAQKPRVLIMLSKFDHCLMDLLYRVRAGSLAMEVVGVVSNHELARAAVEHAGLPFHYWPGGRQARADNEARLLHLIEEQNVELIVLARYMQILSSTVADRFANRIINIHHSFLPSFKGAEPYSRAHARGVKMIGATAHFVTSDLDEGPIIAQGVADIRHDMRVADLIDVGRDVEARILARAVRYYVQRRILLNGIKTVVFD